MKPLLFKLWLLFGWYSVIHGMPGGGVLRAAEPDRAGPRLLLARVLGGVATNVIEVRFDEPLLASTAKEAGNYSVTLFGTTNQVPVLRVLYLGGPPSFALLLLGTNNWHVGGASNYHLTVNRVRDLAGNTIAPDSRIGIAWPDTQYFEVLRPDAVWRYRPHNFQQSWASCDDTEDPWAAWWAEGAGPFRSSSSWPPPEECFGPGTNLWFGGGPSLFRTTFVWPSEYAAGLLRLDWLVQASAIFYLNGVEIFRLYLCPPPADLTNQPAACCQHHVVAPPTCGTNVITVTNLVAGTNCLAVAVLPCHCLPANFCGGWDIAFGLRLQAARLVPGPVPAELPPALQIAPHSNNAVRLWWTGSGYALETATNPPSASSAPAPDSWSEVSDVSNPYTNLVQPDSGRWFRLRK